MPEVTATWAHDASGTWLCRETPGTETHCATLPIERVGRPALDRGAGGAPLVRALWVGDDRATMSGAITAQRRGEYVARENAVRLMRMMEPVRAERSVLVEAGGLEK